MALKIGIVGLPNVGKSTLFNALTKQKTAQAANYPFCTIDPNVGVIEVPDERLKSLSDMAKPEKIIPAVVEFVDIAGLVKGASKGEGLGNKFLANIRECDAIAQVVRYFKDEDIIHVHGNIDPRRDVEIVESELILADLQTIENRLAKLGKQAKSGDKELKRQVDALEGLNTHLGSANLARTFERDDEVFQFVKNLQLLTDKPLLYIVNIHENDLSDFDLSKVVSTLNLPEGSNVVPICARLEEELINFGDDESVQYLKELGLTDTGLNTLINNAYDILGLHTYFTVGKQEVRAWTVKKGALAPQAAGVIHTDFEKGFIKAEVVHYLDLLDHGGENEARKKGLVRLEGKEYEVK
ncbi:redox-regulated ATPase YchF, partial [Patescibacteria group bacterium]|nr:redox-regulated ATPase YchF [Patescibacteria group bacterium]